MTKLDFENLTDLNLLLSVEGIGPGKIRNLLTCFDSICNILNASYSALTRVEGISENQASRIIKSLSSRKEIADFTYKQLELAKKHNTNITTIWDENYPQLLKKIYDPPLLLFHKGNFCSVDDKSLAIVGTRIPTSHGRVQAERFAKEISSQGITIVSGMARGIDTIAHTATLRNNGRTIAVIGSGMDVIYPPENKNLFHELAEKGMVISEYAFGTRPDAINFPKRNRIISGLSLGTIVVETGIKGGALQTAHFALDQGREVFAVPGNLGAKQTEGTNSLIKKGEAKLVMNSEDVFVELAQIIRPGQDPKPLDITQFNLFEQKILEVLDGVNVEIDDIALKTGLSTNECLVQLLQLEFKGVVKQLPGKVFSRFN